MSGIIYTEPPGGSGGGGGTILNAANDGLSTDLATGKIAQLGQAVGRVGNPAILLEEREIPLNAFGIFLSGMTAANAAITIKQLTSPLNAPMLLFQDSAGNEIARIVFNDNESIFIGHNAGVSVTTGITNIGIGEKALEGLITGGSNIAIGSGAMQHNGGASAFNIVIGQDSLDRNFVSVGSGNLIFGHLNSNNGVQPIGNNNLFIGNSVNNTGTLATGIGASNIILGSSNVMGGNLNNSAMLGMFNNGGPGAEMTLSNVFLIARPDQNVIIGIVQPFTDNGNKLQVYGNIFSTGGLAPNLRTTAALANTFGPLDYTVLCDATAGNLSINVDPTITKQRLGNIKKIDASLNSVTINAVSGTISRIGTPAPSFAFNTQGTNIQFQSDGVNLYIL